MTALLQVTTRNKQVQDPDVPRLPDPATRELPPPTLIWVADPTVEPVLHMHEILKPEIVGSLVVHPSRNVSFYALDFSPVDGSVTVQAITEQVSQVPVQPRENVELLAGGVVVGNFERET